MISIEIESASREQWLFGIYAMQAEGQNQLTGDIEKFNCLQIGLLFFTISFYFK